MIKTKTEIQILKSVVTDTFFKPKSRMLIGLLSFLFIGLAPNHSYAQCLYDVTCPVVTDLGSFDCNQLDQIPDLPTNVTTAEAAPYNIDIGDMPCDPITVSAVDDIAVDVCVDGGQTITRTVTITDGTNTTDCVFTYNIVEDDTNPFIMCPTAVTLQCVMDIPEPLNPVSGQFVRVSLVGPEALSLAEVEVYSAGVNVALTGVASQSSLDFGGLASRAIDGNRDGIYANNSVTHTMNEPAPFWIVDLGAVFSIDEIRVFNRTDACCVARLDNYTLEILDDAMNVEYSKGPNPAPDVWHAHFPSYDIVGFDNCVGDLTPTYVGDISDGLICPENVTRTFRLTDACGNFMECEQLFVFDDTQIPAFVDPPENIASSQGMVCGDPIDPHALETTYAEGFPSISDNCLGMNITPADLMAEIPAPWDGTNFVLANGYEIAYSDFIIVHPEGICTAANQRKYRIERTWTITDPCGNTRSSDPEEGGTGFDFQRINVNDGNRNPVVRAINGFNVFTNGSCEVTVNAIDLDAGSDDNCGLYDPNDPSMFDVSTTLMIRVEGSGDPLSPSLTFDMSDFDLSAACPAQISLELWISDECGNSDFAVTFINIQDNTPPAISCISDVSGLDCNSILPLPATDYTSFVAMGGAISDECSGTNVTVSSIDNVDPSSFTFCQGDGPFVVERTYTISDECGSVSNCTQLLSYEADIDGPTIISCPDDILLECPAEANDAYPVVNGQFVRISIPAFEYLSVAEVEVYSAGTNIALTGTASQSSNFDPVTGLADLGIDGNRDGDYFTGMSVTATSNTDAAPFWIVDLGGEFDIDEIRIFNRTDCCPERLNDYTLEVLDASMSTVYSSGPNPAPDSRSAHFLSYDFVASDNCSNEMSIALIDEQTIPPTNCVTKVMRTYAVFDECGNSSDPCVQMITISDTTPPVISCATIDTIEGCDENAILAATGLAYAPFADGININLFPGTIMEDCQIEDASYSDVITDDMCPNPIFQVTRTWTVTDFCGNTSNTCSQVLVVEDTTPPNFVAPPENISVNQGLTCQDAYDPHTLETRFGEGFPEISDPCLASNITTSDLEGEIAAPWDGTSITLMNDYTISYLDSIAPHPGGLCTEDEQRKYRVYRFWTVTDPCGNTMTSDPDAGGPGFDFQRINFGDGPTSPTAVAIANPLNLALTSSCNVTIDVNMIEAGSFDNCGINDPNDPSIFDVATTAEIRILNSGDPFTTSLVLDQTDFDLSMACPAQVSIELQVTDECGNTGTSVAVLLISDKTDPMISACPGPASFEGCDENDIAAPHLPYSDVDADASELDFTSLGGAYTDNCGIASVTYRDALNNTGCPNPTVTITRTWTITDHCGNVAGCNQTLSINDTTAPSYVDPPNNVSADQGLMCGDAFDPHSLETRFGEGFPEISDPCLSANIMPSDLMTEIPEPWDGAEYLLLNNYRISFVDDIVPHPEGLCTNDEQRKYRINRTWTITDPCGNSMSSDPMVGGTGFDFQRINIGDGPTAPTAVAIVTPLNLDLSESCEVTVDVSDIENGSFDNCGIDDINDPSTFDVPSTAVIRILGSGDAFVTSLVIDQTDFDLSMGCPANVVIELQVTDDCENTGTATALVIIEDALDPIITACPGDASFEGCDEDDITSPHLPYSDVDAVASEMEFSVIGGSYSENCGLAAITYKDVLNATGCPSPTANITRTWTLTDHCGNVASCSHTLNITDTTAPSYVAPPNNVSIDQGLMCGDAFDPHSLETRFGEGFPEISDPCLSSNITPSDLMTEIAEPWDGVEVVLNNDYRISFVDDIVPHPDGLCTTDHQRKYRINRTWTITDPCGNSMTSDPMIGGVGFDFQRINIGDAQNPEAVVRDLLVSLNSCTATLVASVFENGSTDNCGIYDPNDPSNFDVTTTGMIRIKDSGDPFAPTLTLDGTTLDFTMACSANIIVEYMVSDECGNTNVAESNVEVQEFEAPTCQTQDITLIITEPGQIFTVSPQDIDNGSSDLCSGISMMTVTPNVFDCDDVGITEVVLTVTDNACNTSSCTANVTLIDGTVPVCVVQDITVNLDDNGEVIVDASQVDDGTSTFCGAGFTTQISPNTFTCIDLGPNQVIFTATTDYGESCSAMAVVNVVDNTPPTVNFPPDITVMSQTEIDLDGENLDMRFGDIIAVMDNCPGEPNILTMANARFVSCSEIEIVRDWIVYDSSGNSTEGQQVVTVLGPVNSVNPDADAAVCWDAKDDDPTGTVEINGNADVFYDFGTIISHNWSIVDDAGLGLSEAANLLNSDTDIVTLDVTTVDPITKFGVFEITMSYQIEDSNDCTSALITFPVSITIPQCGELPWKGN